MFSKTKHKIINLTVPAPNIANFIKSSAVTSVISIAAGLSIIFATRLGLVDKNTDGLWVVVLTMIVNFLMDVPVAIFEISVCLYLLFFSYFSNTSWLYKITKWFAAKIFLGLAIVPMAYSVAMLGVPFIQFSTLAIVNSIGSYLLAFSIIFLFPEDVNHDRGKKNSHPN